MRSKHIIVEGCDGSGKDTLIDQLLDSYPKHVVHERASTSLGGPVQNLADWVATDAIKMSNSGPWIYNRHPLISEPIYAHYRKVNPGLSGVWSNGAWVNAYRQIIARDCVLIICQPPMATVLDTLTQQGPDAHMPGVYENAREIWMHYAAFMWPGKTIRYNYTSNSYKSLVDVLTRYLEN